MIELEVLNMAFLPDDRCEWPLVAEVNLGDLITAIIDSDRIWYYTTGWKSIPRFQKSWNYIFTIILK